MTGKNEIDRAVARRGRRTARVAACLAAVVTMGLVAGPVARAQIPEVPDLPPLPPEAQEAIETVEDAVVPVLVDVATEAQVLTNLIGFALRPGCALTGTAVLLLTLVGSTFPVSVGFVSTPVLILCAGAFAEGPADAVFDEVDEAVGPEIEEALAPIYGAQDDLCGVIGLLGSAPQQVPPPLNRVDLVRLLCG